jgi:glycosyltransferase involved in cell wall biosynthesis
MSNPTVSVIINNYNYGRFLPAAIDSVLGQTYRPIETIIVDDGSTDKSRDIISRYRSEVLTVFQSNRGQASAFNAGVRTSRGVIISFLDADDFYYPDKVERVAELFAKYGTNARRMMVHHRLALWSDTKHDFDGQLIGRTHESPLNIYNYAKRYRYFYYPAGPTTGLSLNRMLADRLFPIPEDGVRVSADDFLVRGAALIGELYSMAEVLAGYRIHNSNLWFSSPKAKSKEFREIEQKFLNMKLLEDGMLPVISFRDSMHSWQELLEDRKWLKLAFRMLKVSLRQRDRYTARFVRETIKTAVYTFGTSRKDIATSSAHRPQGPGDLSLT